MKQLETKKAYSVDDVVHISSIGRTTIFRLLKEGRLESIHIGSRRLILADSLDRLLKGEKAGGGYDHS